MSTDPKQFLWGEETLNTRSETEKAIESFCADNLCNADCGMVEHDGRTFGIEVMVALVDQDDESANPQATRLLRVTNQELATITAALAYFQATNGGKSEGLALADVNALAEKLNFPSDEEGGAL